MLRAGWGDGMDRLCGEVGGRVVVVQSLYTSNLGMWRWWWSVLLEQRGVTERIRGSVARHVRTVGKGGSIAVDLV